MNQAHLLAILTALVGDRAFIQSFESGALPETLDYYLDLARRLLAAAEASVPDLPFNLDDLGDVDVASADSGDLLVFNGTDWIPQGGVLTITVNNTNAATLTVDQYQGNTYFRVVPGSPAPTGDIEITVPAEAHSHFTVENYTAQTVLIQQAGSGFVTNYGIPTFETRSFFADGDLGGEGVVPFFDANTANLLYLRLDTTNDPLTGDLNVGSNDITNVRSVRGGGVVAGVLALEGDENTTQTGGVRGVFADPEFTAMTGGNYTGLGVLPGLGTSPITFDSVTVAGVPIFASSSVDYIFKGTSTAPELIAVGFGTNGASESAIDLQTGTTNYLSAFLFTNRQTFQVTNGAAQKLVVTSMNDEPTYRIQGAGSSLDLRPGGFISQPHFPATTGGATGTVAGTEGVDGLVQFRANMQAYETGWTMNERAGFFYASPGADTDGGTINAEYVLKTRNVDVDFPSVYLAPAGSRYLIYSDDSTGVIAHAGKMSLGAISGSPAATLAVTGTGRFTDVVTSTVSTGTAPFTIASTTKVTNLNADLLDDQSGAYYLDSANFTGTNWTDLTDGGGTTLHTHAHTNLTGNTVGDDHTQYALLAGRSGGQTLIGGTAAADFLKLQATAGVGVGSEYIAFLTGNNGATEVMRALDSKLGIGTTTAANATRLEVVETSTATSGNAFPIRCTAAINPASSSSGTFYAVDSQTTFTDGNAQALTGSMAAYRGISNHRGDSNVTTIYGGLFQTFLGPTIGAQADLATATDVVGFQLQAVGNSNLTNTTDIMATRLTGGLFAVSNNGRGTISKMVAGHFNVACQDADAIITAAYGIRVKGTTTAEADVLTAGTITDGIMVEIGDWNSGPTYTNPPVQLKLVSATPTGAIGIWQDGTGAYNIYDGATAYTAVSQTLSAAGNTITATSTYKELDNSTGASLTLTSTPTIADGQDGQILILVNKDSADNIVLQDQGTLASSNLRLAGAANLTLGPRDSVTLIFSTALGDWIQIAASNN